MPLCAALALSAVNSAASPAQDNPLTARLQKMHQFAARRAGSGFSTYFASLVLGQPDFTSSSVISSATLSGPTSVTMGCGRVYAADMRNNRVLWWNSTSSYYTGRGADGVIGQPDFTSDSANRDNGGAPAADSLYNPYGVVVDTTTCAIWVSDLGNLRVLRFPEPSAGTDATADVVLGQPNFTTHISGCTQNEITNPHHIALDPTTGNVWVTDYYNNRLLEYSSATISGFSDGTALNADLALGHTSFTSSNRDYFQYPSGVTADTSGNLWVTDSDNNRILEYYAATLAAQSGGTAVNLSADATLATALTFNQPENVAVSADGTALWVADWGDNRVIKYTAPFTSTHDTPLVLGQQDTTTVSTAAIGAATLFQPSDVTLDSSGNVWVADKSNNRVLEYVSPSATGASASVALGQTSMTNFNHWIVTAASLYQPQDAVEGGGRVYAADAYNNRVLWWNSSTAYTNGRAADGVIGQANFTDFIDNRNLSAPAADTLYFPSGVAVDASSNVWVNDEGNSRVLRFAAPSAGTDAVANLVLGQADFVSSGYGTTRSTFYYPYGIRADASGNVWVADNGNNRVLEFSSATIAGYTSGTATAADKVFGQADFTTGSSGSTATSLYYPSGISIDKYGGLWVTDYGNSRVVRYSSATIAGWQSGTASSADLVLGQAGFTANSSATSQNGLYYPNGVGADSSGNLWVADQGNNRVVEYSSAAIAGWTSTVASSATLVLGQPDFVSGGYGVSSSTFYEPAGVFVASSGNIWIPDTGNNRVLEYIISSGYSAAGSISIGTGTLSGVTLTLTGTASATLTSGSDGTFSFTGLANGTYNITPSKSGYTFSPASVTVTITNGNVSSLSFTATHTVSSNLPALYVKGGPNGYAQPTRGYPAKIEISDPAQSGLVTVKIYTVRDARLVRTLTAGATAGAALEIVWDGHAGDGEMAGSGVYVALINGAGYDNEKIKIGVLK